MSALAQLYASKGAHATGSDRATSPVVELLLLKGIEVFIGHDAAHIHPSTTRVVYSDAIPKDNSERVWAREHDVEELSYFEALGKATEEGTSIIISGTHGKTSTTAMIAKILIDAGKEPTVIAGSILSEYGSNFVAGKNDLFVIEGCEYRRHFLHLHPTVLVITNIELDHTDYYKDLADMQDAFQSVIAHVPPYGTVVTNTSSGTIAPLLSGTSARVVAYQELLVPDLRARGEFNRENARAAKGAVQALFGDIAEKDIDVSLQVFTGTWRRFEYKGKTSLGALVYDDYAHHPTAVRSTIEMAHEEFPDKHIVVVFHPHLYSRTKDFFDGFAEALSLADSVILLPVYAAREAYDPSVRSEKLAEAISHRGGSAEYAESFDVAETLLEEKGSDTLILTMGAGDVYQVGESLLMKTKVAPKVTV
ncbi:MAG: UDP-N-acetylmuramate-L-alanine ligase [Parcubacteria group bacterium GW2011_GWD2_42_14]|nr:MAG: UDP-N-acetylmuramate-L-alanine ligase [Parcubacteria group bacterium GW2011_GWD2_42_14]